VRNLLSRSPIVSSNHPKCKSEVDSFTSLFPPKSSLLTALSGNSNMADSTAAAAATAASTRPTRPDTDLFNEKLGKAEKEYQDVMTKYVSAVTRVQPAKAPISYPRL